MNPDRMIDLATAAEEVLSAYGAPATPMLLVELTLQLELAAERYDPAQIIDRLSPEEISAGALGFGDDEAEDAVEDELEDETEAYEEGWELGFRTSQRTPLEIYQHAIRHYDSGFHGEDQAFERGFRDGMESGFGRNSDG